MKSLLFPAVILMTLAIGCLASEPAPVIQVEQQRVGVPVTRVVEVPIVEVQEVPVEVPVEVVVEKVVEIAAPTATPLPTYTPYPTATPRPTYTPLPEPTPRTVYEVITPTPYPTPTPLPERWEHYSNRISDAEVYYEFSHPDGWQFAPDNWPLPEQFPQERLVTLRSPDGNRYLAVIDAEPLWYFRDVCRFGNCRVGPVLDKSVKMLGRSQYGKEFWRIGMATIEHVMLVVLERDIPTSTYDFIESILNTYKVKKSVSTG